MKQGKKSWCCWHDQHTKHCPDDCGYAMIYKERIKRAIAKRKKLRQKRLRTKRLHKTCPVCSKSLSGKKQTTCSRECRKQITLNKQAKRAASKTSKRSKFCRQCNKEISLPKLVFCGSLCSDKWHYAKAKTIERLRAAQRKIERDKIIASLAGKSCAICHRPFNPVCETQKYCSRKCGRKPKDRKRDKRRRLSIHHVIKERLSNRLRELLSKQGKQKQNGITAYMGCTPKEMMDHVERQFRDGMNWGNYGVSGWHLDHIIPCERFDLTREDHCRVCFNWRNIRPLWGKDNWTRQHMLTLNEALNIDPGLTQMAKDAGVQLW